MCEKLVFIQVYEYPEASGGGVNGFSLAFVLVTQYNDIIGGRAAVLLVII